MKFFILLAGLIAMTPSSAFADYFKIYDGTVYIPNASVILNGQTIGHTDAYGRVQINNLANGDYHAQIQTQQGVKTVLLHIDGKGNLKSVQAH